MKKLMFAVIGLMLAGSVWAASTSSFTYQARLCDEHGDPIQKDGKTVRNQTVTLRLWSAPLNGDLLWGRVFTILTNEEGLFNLEVTDDGGKLEKGEPTYSTLTEVFSQKNAGDVYVGIEVKDSAGEIVPRQRLFSVPYAAVAHDVKEISGDIVAKGNISFGDGKLVVTGDGIEQNDGANVLHDVTVTGKLTVADDITINSPVMNFNGEAKFNNDVEIAGERRIVHGNDELIPVPVGGIIMWTKTELPDNEHWAFCDGSNGTPDLRTRFVVGASNDDEYKLNKTGGEAFHTLSVGEMPSHNHPYSFKGADVDAAWDDDNYFYNQSEKYGGNNNTKYTDYVGGGQAHENRPPFYALNFIMRIK